MPHLLVLHCHLLYVLQLDRIPATQLLCLQLHDWLLPDQCISLTVLSLRLYVPDLLYFCHQLSELLKLPPPYPLLKLLPVYDQVLPGLVFRPVLRLPLLVLHLRWACQHRLPDLQQQQLPPQPVLLLLLVPVLERVLRQWEHPMQHLPVHLRHLHQLLSVCNLHCLLPALPQQS